MKYVANGLKAGLCLWVLFSGSIRSYALPPECEATPVTKPALNWKAPCDVSVDWEAGIDETQRAFDIFAWQSFISINWPVSDFYGLPDTKRTFEDGKRAATVWETWMPEHQVFGKFKPGEKPEWNGRRLPPQACQLTAVEPAGDTAEPDGEKGGATAMPMKMLEQVSKVPRDLEQIVQPFAAPLVDQNGEYVRYEILMNQVMFDYIVDNDLYTKEGVDQAESIEPTFGSNPEARPGSMVIKAAWKVMQPDEDTSKIHIARALVIDPDTAECSREVMGLVGLHLVVRTANAPGWIWATFEHVDNAPSLRGGKVRANKKTAYHFYDQKSKAEGNTMPPRPWTAGETNKNFTQVVRMTPIKNLNPDDFSNKFQPFDTQVQKLNRSYQKLMKKANKDSVWANYQLVSVQHASKPPRVPGVLNGDNPLGDPVPPFLANAVIETYDQGRLNGDGKVELTPQGSSSCMDCHSRATYGPDSKNASFSFLFNHAQPLDDGKESK